MQTAPPLRSRSHVCCHFVCQHRDNPPLRCPHLTRWLRAKRSGDAIDADGTDAQVKHLTRMTPGRDRANTVVAAAGVVVAGGVVAADVVAAVAFPVAVYVYAFYTDVFPFDCYFHSHCLHWYPLKITTILQWENTWSCNLYYSTYPLSMCSGTATPAHRRPNCRHHPLTRFLELAHLRRPEEHLCHLPLRLVSIDSHTMNCTQVWNYLIAINMENPIENYPSRTSSSCIGHWAQSRQHR